MKVLTHLLAADGSIPNHPRWPLLIYPQALKDGALGIVGAYPEGSKPDLCRPDTKKTAHAPLPACDPVYGAGGPLFEHWK